MWQVISLMVNREQRKLTQEGTRARQSPYRHAHNGLVPPTRDLLFISNNAFILLIYQGMDSLICQSPQICSLVTSPKPPMDCSPQAIKPSVHKALKDRSHLSTPVTENDVGTRSQNSKADFPAEFQSAPLSVMASLTVAGWLQSFQVPYSQSMFTMTRKARVYDFLCDCL